jgi:hypothetical protein
MGIFLLRVGYGQSSYDFSQIDHYVQNIENKDPDSLAKQLTEPYQTDIEKVRAIYSWIAQHIAYNTFIFNSRPYSSARYITEPEDTSMNWRSGNEMTALKVLRKRIAVCDGYAKLFQTLCLYAGIRSELVVGYARGYNSNADRFRTNHTWNVVMVDNHWKLIDVTWGSGYIDYANQFVQHLDESYFLANPKQFIWDHYPEELQWALLDNPPAVREFTRVPFKLKSYVKYSIKSFYPSAGIVEAAIGDTLQFELYLKDPEKDRAISADPFFDSSILTKSPSWIFVNPSKQSGSHVYYTHVVQSAGEEWVHILYNNDIVLRYKLNIRMSTALH